MFYYNLQNIDIYIQSSTLLDDINTELSNLNKIINIYFDKNQSLQNMHSAVLNITNCINTAKIDEFNSTLDILKDVIKNISNYISLIKKQKNSLNHIIDIIKNDFTNLSEIKSSLIEYNKYHETLDFMSHDLEININKVYNLVPILSSSIQQNNLPDKLNSFTEYTNHSNYDIDNLNSDILNNNLLLVSEKDQKAYLPYNQFDIEKIYQSKPSTFSCLQDVIKKLYILPLKNFNHSAISRFREGYKLIKEKQNGSMFSAISLGVEIMFKYNLNPIVVAACRNIDELYIYLDCLEENELSSFKCFKIKFEINPKI